MVFHHAKFLLHVSKHQALTFTHCYIKIRKGENYAMGLRKVKFPIYNTMGLRKVKFPIYNTMGLRKVKFPIYNIKVLI